jgi:histone H3/H4
MAQVNFNCSKTNQISPVKKQGSQKIVVSTFRNQNKCSLKLIISNKMLTLILKIREIISSRTGNRQFRVTETAVEALREASETMITTIFEDSNLLALHAKRVTLFPRDMSLLLRLRNDFNLLTSSN